MRFRIAAYDYGIKENILRLLRQKGFEVTVVPAGTSAEEVLALLRTLNREHGKTIVMVTHDPKAASYASHTLHLDKGVLVTGREAVA